MCRDCGLAQLSYIVEPEEMYTKDYLYEASITATADKHWGELADDVIRRTGIAKGRMIDIGGNDGTLALKFKERGFNVLNIDPCKEVTDISRQRGVPTLTEFFNKNTKAKSADIITGTNVFAHVNDLDGFIEGVLANLAPKGVFVFESPYFGEFLKGLEYDTVYHQHLSYLSLKPLIKFLNNHGLEIFDVAFSPLHGGAFRCFISRINEREVQNIVRRSAEKEDWTEDYLMDWGKKCREHADKLFAFVYQEKLRGKTFCCVSAPAKGQTLLNYTGMGKYIDFVTEKSKLKIGRYTPGTKIKIVGDEELIKRQPDYAIILAWNFAPEIIKNNPNYKGTWIIPLPEICLKTKED
jgi:SAM-dependent methyltransferase